jgi:hypothetical protein
MPRYGSTDRRLSDRGADWSEGTTDVTLTEVREIHRLVVAPVWPISRLRTYGLTKTLAGFVALMLNHFVKVSVLLIGRKCSRSSRIG